MAEFIIIQYFVTALGVTSAQKEYAIVTAKAQPNGGVKAVLKHIPREDALEYIEDNGLVLAMGNKHGRVYDTPDKKFLAKYGGRIEIPRL